MAKVLYQNGLVVSISIHNSQELLWTIMNYMITNLTTIQEISPQPNMDRRIRFLMERWGFTLTDGRFG